MPAWKTHSSAIFPFHSAFFIFWRPFPKRKITQIFLFGVKIYSRASFEVFQIKVSKICIFWKFSRVEINSIAGFIGKAFFRKIFNNSDLLRDKICCFRKIFRCDQIEIVHPFQEFVRIKFCNFPDSFSFSPCAFFEFVFAIVFIRNQMSNIGNIHRARYIITIQL